MAMFGRATRNDVLRSYTPTMAERIPIALQGMFGKLGLDKYKARSFAKPIADALEWSPLGAAAAAIDAGVAARKSPTTTGMFGNLAGGAALAALGAVPGGKALRGVARDAERGIVAYHGSPHTFDKFSLDKIGTGEGAQAYGHGLYFAENEAVARQYRDDLTARVIGGANRAAAKSGGDLDAAISATEAEIARLMALPNAGGDMTRRDGLVALQKQRLDELNARKAGQGATGSMYQVRINADPADFLDWDKPLAEQSDKVRAALAGLPNSPGDIEGAMQIYRQPGPTRGGVARDNSADLTRLESMKWRADSMPASDYYKQLAETTNMMAGKHTKAADMLNGAGIPGIKYLDAGSRGAGDGSRNFVVFNDKLIDILKRYGWVPGTAVPTALMARAQSEAMGTPEAGGI